MGGRHPLPVTRRYWEWRCPPAPVAAALLWGGRGGGAFVPFLTWNSSRKVVVAVVPNRENLVGKTLHTKNKTEEHKHTQRLEILH